jgi:inosine/xanthosine triphosphatase
MLVTVGSQNRVKIRAAANAFAAVFPNQNWTVTGTDCDSGVSSQPLTEEETLLGARNRAAAAREASSHGYGVGLEGGLVTTCDQLMECGWVVVIGPDGREGLAATARIALPPSWHQLLLSGRTLEELTDLAWNTRNAGQHGGFYGLVTNNQLTRERACRDAIVFALAPFLYADLYTAGVK